MSQSARWARHVLLVVVLLLCMCIIRLVNLQIIQTPGLAVEGEVVRTSKSDTAARRGQITDMTGMVLADLILAYDIAVNQENIRKYVHYEKQEVEGQMKNVVVSYGPTEAARQLSELLDTSAAKLGGLFMGSSKYGYVRGNVDAVTYRKIRALNVYGIKWEAAYERTYPNGALATPVIRAVGANGRRSSGVEAQYTDSLKGISGMGAFETAPNGAVIPGSKQTVRNPVDDASVALTIHAGLQHQIQELLSERMSRHQTDRGSIVVEDVSAGQILVLADSNSAVPDDANLQAVSTVQYAVKPGSVGKLVTFATALEAGSITPTTVFNVPYQLDLADAGSPITDFHEHSDEVLTATRILAEFSNTGTVLVGQTVSDRQRYTVMRGLGFGESAGIELLGETGGSVRPDTEWLGYDRYVSIFGQSYSTSPLQEASFLATIVNGGVRIAPRIVKSVANADGTVIIPEAPTPTQAMNVQTAQALMTMMGSVVEDRLGTAGAAKVNGCRLGAKTDTAGIILENGNHSVVSATTGLLPVDTPRLAISVVLYNSKVGYISPDSSAPLFGDVARVVVKNLGIPASPSSPDLYPTTPTQ